MCKKIYKRYKFLLNKTIYIVILQFPLNFELDPFKSYFKYFSEELDFELHAKKMPIG